MNLPAFCIHRPAFTIVISLVMTIIGIIGYMNLPVRWIPNVTQPIVTINTAYPGANARLVEHDVTKVIEEGLSGISGIEMMNSNSRQNRSFVSITFKMGQNMNAAVEDVRSSLERVRGMLPKEIQTPIVTKADTNNMPILFVSLYGARYNEREIGDYVDKYISPVFETIDGVGSVEVYGGRVSAMRIWLDPVKMAGAGVTVEDVTQLLQDQSASIPSGQIRGVDRFYSVMTNTSLKTPEQFNDLIIRDQQNQAVRLKDIGEATIAAEDAYSSFRITGKPAIALGIIPQSMANPLDVEAKVQKVLAELKRSLPTGMSISVEYNQADYIRASIQSVYESFFEAILFVWLVILIFLCSFRATIIPIITIPVCLISSFSLLYFMRFSINTITLMALVLAIGLVVDDAIVMLENISRHMEKGLSAFAAALKGSREIIFPIIAMTLTLAAVYAPIAFTPGLLGVLFREFTFTLAGAVIISGVVALTLSPMMCARVLKPVNESGRYQRWFTRQIQCLQTGYEAILSFLLRKRHWVLASLILIGSLGLTVYKFIPSELAPQEDMNEINVFVSAPRSASFQYTDSYVKQLESIYKEMPEVESYFSQAGSFSPAHAFQVLKLKPRNQRSQSTTQLVAALNEQLSTIPGVRVNVFTPSPSLAEVTNSDSGDNIGLVLMTSSDYRKLQQVTQQMMEQIKKNPGFVHVDNGLKWDSEQFQLNLDREKAADLKISIPSVANTLSTLLAGRTIGKTEDANIIVQMKESALSNPNIFQQIYTRNADGRMVPLSQILSMKETITSEIFRRFERLRSDTIYITLGPKFKIADAVKELEKIAKQTLPEDMKFTFTGEAKSFLESNGKTMFTFLLALIFIYLVLVAQFESFIDPLVIMLTVPFALVGALLTLKLFSGTLNIYSNIGLITLIGLIAKHGILITDFANRLRSEGQSVHAAVVKAASLRLRPILMTTAAMVLGALPLAFAFGPGSESRQQVGLVITGGLIFGTFFSLIVVPITYTYLSPLRKKFVVPDSLQIIEQE